MPFLSELIKRPVVDAAGERIGKLSDVIVSAEKPYPCVKAVMVVTSNKKRINVPWGQVHNFGGEITLNVDRKALKEYTVKEHDVCLVIDVLDRQVVDVEGKKIRRVNDLQLSRTNGYYRLIGVDISARGVLRRLGLERAAGSMGIRPHEDYIDWRDIDTITSDVSTVKLRVPKYNLTKLHPADIADIVDQLSLKEGISLINSLDEEAAADALEETSPEKQVSIFEGMDAERAAEILDEMSPDDAADLIGDLSTDKAQEILELMNPDESEDIIKLLEYPEKTAGGIMTTEFIALNKELTAQQTLEAMRDLAKDVESIYYIYVTENGDDLVGVTSLREILLASPGQKLSEFMHEDIIKVDVLEDQNEVARKIAKYNLLALPVVEHNRKLKGIVTVDDAIDIVLPTAWKKRVPKMFG